MRRVRKMIAAATMFIMVAGAFSSDLAAQEYCTSTGGCGYEDSICTPSLTPYIALGTVLIVAIVAIAVRHHGHHHHNHAHCH